MRGVDTHVAELLTQHEYSVIRKVGQGSFGKAILVEKGGSQCICKCVDFQTASRSQQQATVEESRLLSSLRSPYIVRHTESFSDRSTFCIVMDYCEAGDLASRIGLKWRRRQFFEEELVLAWTTQILLALEYIHSQNVIHRDVKPHNLFVTKSGSLQLGDFGMAKALASSGDCATAQVGTPYYLSPEVWQGKQYHCASDIWAAGCILHELCTLHVPFEGTCMTELMHKVCNGPLPILNCLCSEAVENLCMAMMTRDPDSRITAAGALQTSELAPYVELEGEVARDRCGLQRIACTNVDVPATPYRTGDEVEYLSDPGGAWTPARVVAVNAEGEIRFDSSPSHWVSKSAQALNVRLVRIRDSTLSSESRRSSSPGIVVKQVWAPARQCTARPSSGPYLSRHEVASRLMGISPQIASCRPSPLCSNAGGAIACC
jgi:serine/threonine protein kinase